MTKWRFLDMNLNFMKLREQMENQKVSYYLVPSEDPHQSEYVDDYFKCRQYISGFTGSAGTFLLDAKKDGFGLMDVIYAGRRTDLF